MKKILLFIFLGLCPLFAFANVTCHTDSLGYTTCRGTDKDGNRVNTTSRTDSLGYTNISGNAVLPYSMHGKTYGIYSAGNDDSGSSSNSGKYGKSGKSAADKYSRNYDYGDSGYGIYNKQKSKSSASDDNFYKPSYLDNYSNPATGYGIYNQYENDYLYDDELE